MSAGMFAAFLAGATSITFAVNLACVLYIGRRMRRSGGRERDIAAMLYKIAIYELLPVGLFAALFVLRAAGVLPPSSTSGVTALVIAIFVTLTMIGLVMPGVCAVALLRARR